MRFLLLFLLSITNGVTFAQDYPTKPVRIIEPFGAGGGPDVVARAISPKLSELWGQPVTVENHPGKGSTAVSYTHLDVYKRQPLSPQRESISRHLR